MNGSDREASASRLADTKQAAGKRRRWPEELKREIVAALTEVTSVNVVEIVGGDEVGTVHAAFGGICRGSCSGGLSLSAMTSTPM